MCCGFEYKRFNLTRNYIFLFVEFFSDEEYENYKNLVPRKPIKAKKELGLEDLPPIEDLKISVSEEDCIPVGKVYQIVDQLGNANIILKYKNNLGITRNF